jgi:DNA helicase IV
MPKPAVPPELPRPDAPGGATGSPAGSAADRGAVPGVSNAAAVVAEPAVHAEQRHLDLLYRRLDEMRRRTQDLKDRARFENDGTPAGMFNRDAWQFRYADELAALSAAEDRLCFGRLDTDDGDDRHIGRMGITDGTPDRRHLLVDWRAPAAAPFYTATALAPQGVIRRRHIRTSRRRVLGVSDEFLQASDLPAEADELGVGGDSALVEALNAPRTGRMADIIETIQAEQDTIIRSDRSGILVVQGGPGTGKTVVALHRAAYLLYTYRERLGSHGVLVIGPSRTFLDYIGAVLPSLGETSVVLATTSTLVPGVTATAIDEPAVAELKGRPMMAGIIDNAVLDRQRVPRSPRVVPYDRGTVRLEPSLLRAAQRRAWGSRLPHNRARSVFVRTVINGLARQVVARPGVRQLEPDPVQADLGEIRKDLAGDPGIQAALADLWPALTPERLVTELFTGGRLDVIARNLPVAQRELLRRKPDDPLTESDIPLVDEAAELLGEVAATDLRAAAEAAAELAFARETLEALQTAAASQADGGVGYTVGMLSAEDLADQHVAPAPAAPTGSIPDRDWTYGHVIVDEAQELSGMAWRMVMRRCPLKSMTVVGDVAQTSDPGGSTSWARALNPHARGRWRLTELTVNYRTPTEIMALAAPVLAAINRDLAAPTSLRDSGHRPWSVRAASEERLAEAVATAVAGQVAEMDGGQLAVLHAAGSGAGGIADGGRPLLDAVRSLVPDAEGAAGPGRRVVVLDVHQAKGLEFDRVIVVEPAAMLEASGHGLGDLYVALTRATQDLGVVHARPLPGVLDPRLLERRG